jgi:hypothetical protein
VRHTALRVFQSAATAILLLASTSPATAQIRYPMPVPYPYGFREGDSSLRVDVKPKEAAVYVDGYYAGIVDDFDGTFQRLHVIPGPHEIIVYLEGHRPLRQQMYLSPGATRKITGSLEPLAAGEANEPPPTPAAAPFAPQAPFGRGAGPRQGPRPPERQPAPDNQSPQAGPPASTLGTLSLLVQPAGADVTIDRESWKGPERDERLIVQLSAGPHVIEIRKSGYRTYTTEVEVRSGETLPLNVSLTRQ